MSYFNIKRTNDKKVYKLYFKKSDLCCAKHISDVLLKRAHLSSM